MIEVKFRAWDSEKKIMHKGMSLYNWFHWAKIHMDNDAEISAEMSEFMQYTGLKDMDDKEIWEGDILKYIYDPESNEYLQEGESTKIIEELGVVRFERGAFYFVNEENGRYEIPITYKRVQKSDLYKVIGNIYQNPELLN